MNTHLKQMWLHLEDEFILQSKSKKISSVYIRDNLTSKIVWRWGLHDLMLKVSWYLQVFSISQYLGVSLGFFSENEAQGTWKCNALCVYSPVSNRLNKKQIYIFRCSFAKCIKMAVTDKKTCMIVMVYFLGKSLFFMSHDQYFTISAKKLFISMATGTDWCLSPFCLSPLSSA